MIDIVFEIARLVLRIELLVEHMEPNTPAYWNSISLAQDLMQIYQNIHSIKEWNKILNKMKKILDEDIVVKKESQYTNEIMRDYFVWGKKTLTGLLNECTTQQLN